MLFIYRDLIFYKNETELYTNKILHNGNNLNKLLEFIVKVAFAECDYNMIPFLRLQYGFLTFRKGVVHVQPNNLPNRPFGAVIFMP